MAIVTTTIAVANQKGGVAKTTTVVSLGAALAELKQRVLLVDVDPQGSLTFSLGIDPEDLDITVAEVLLGTKLAEDAIVITDDGMHLLPANITLTQAEESLVGRTGREQRLRVALDKVADDYDWILIDCPPTLGILTVGALSAAQKVLIPLQAETLSHRGVGCSTRSTTCASSSTHRSRSWASCRRCTTGAPSTPRTSWPRSARRTSCRS
jgi:chromosome partitioning protein